MQRPPNVNDHNPTPNTKLSKAWLAVNVTYSGTNENKLQEKYVPPFCVPTLA